MELIELGYLGLFIGTFLSATIFPFPSDVIVIASYEMGYSVAPVLVVATLGNLLGGLTNYYIGYLGNSERLIKKFKLNQDKLDLWESRLSKWGVYLGLISWFPLIGEPMVAAFGFFRVKLVPLACMMLLGKLIRYSVLTAIYFNVI